jgi:metal-dependent amidase/aminoacylase/carboxypeptidase family protein
MTEPSLSAYLDIRFKLFQFPELRSSEAELTKLIEKIS